MDLGLDPLFLARARREGWELIALTVHILANPFKPFTEQRRLSDTITPGENPRQTPIIKLKFLTIQRDLLWFAKQYLAQKGTYSMKTLPSLILVLLVGISLSPQGVQAETQDGNLVRSGLAALTFSGGAIQKTTPRDGIVNLITGDNQTSGNRMLVGKKDVFYLKLNTPTDVAVGDLFTVYRRVRKVFHPATGEYLGFVTIRVGVVKVTDTDHALTTAEAVLSYGTMSPGDPVMRYVDPAPSEIIGQTSDVADVSGMIVELQADRPMTLVSQGDVVYVDRGREDGLKDGHLMDIYRHSAGLPSRKIGQLMVLSTEDRTATAKIVKANTRVMKGDRYRLVGYSAPVVQPVEVAPPSQPAQATPTKLGQTAAVPADLVASKLAVPDASGQNRINLGDLANFLRYESGEAAIKPEGYKVLDQLIEYLGTNGDSRLIRVEGHTDNVEIGPSLKSRYPSNLELSQARANGVVRYLVEKGGVDSARIDSVGYGDSRPAATNANEEGRTKNRRVEILLYASKTDAAGSTPGEPDQARNEESDTAGLSARGISDKPAVPADDSAETGPGTLSVGLPSYGSTTDGSGTETAKVPGENAPASPDAGTADKNEPSQPAGSPDE
jgi:chemotaxis protein MotB